MIDVLDNIDFTANFESTSLTLNINNRWIAHFEALSEMNLMVQSMFKIIENWWEYQLFCVKC